MSEEKNIEEKSTTTIELKKGLPPVGDLFNEAWKLFQAKWLKLLIYILIVVGATLGAYLVFAILAILTLGAGALLTGGDLGSIDQAFGKPEMYIPFGIVGLVFMAIALSINLAAQAGMILLVADKKQDQSAFSYLKKGFSFIIPLLLLGIISFILMMGGMFALFIPMIVMMIFLGFSMYVAVLENKKAMDAIRMSVGMVSQNFWGILGRMLLFFLLSILVQLVIGQLAESEVMGPLGFVLIMALSIAVSWFSIVYMYSLYKHARSAYDESKKASLTWMWVVAIIGWIFIMLSFGGIMKLVGNQEVKDAFMEGFQSEFQSEMEAEYGEEYNYQDKSFLEITDDLILIGLNEERENEGVFALEKDQQLCAYATRRLQQMEEYGEFDDLAGFIEDSGDQQMWNSFFKGYTNVNNLTFSTDEMLEIEEEEFLTEWNEALNPIYTNACIRSNDDFAVMIVGG